MIENDMIPEILQLQNCVRAQFRMKKSADGAVALLLPAAAQ
jgi:hypothetical protein